MSLGVDLVPRKVCSLDCVYCEVGKTTKLTLERREYLKLNNIEEELVYYFSNNPDPDYITFSGAGEPTLNTKIGDVLRFIKEKKPSLPVAVLTNGTLLSDPVVRESLLPADVVLPSLDAATTEVFEKINRPARGLTIADYIDGIIKFRSEFKGKIWLEVFILPGYNDSREELAELKKAILRIRPDSVQLNTLDRPGTVAGLRGASRAELTRLADEWELENTIIIAASPERKKILAYRSDTETAILETIKRRPCTPDDLTMILGLHINEINKYLDVLESEDKVQTMLQERGIFYLARE